MASAAATILLSSIFASTAVAAGMTRLPGCNANSLVRNDDGSTSAAVPLGFSINFEGNTYNSVWVNNNGNVTFDGPLSAFTPTPIGSQGHVIIAPFWADVDTRNTASNVVTYGTTNFGGQPAFCAEWDGVGYFNQHADKLNKFELILVSRPDRAAGDFDIHFNYDTIKWETGDASSGSNGFGGSSARAGYGLQGGQSFELPGSGQNGAFLDGGPNALASNDENTFTPGQYIFSVHAGQPPNGMGLNGHVSSNGGPLVNAPMEICPQPGSPNSGAQCVTTQTNGQGNYSVVGLPAGLWLVTVNPPAGDQVDTQTTVGPVQVNGSNSVTQNVVMSTVTPPPSNTIVQGNGTFDRGIPNINNQESASLIVRGCQHGSASYQLIQPAPTPTSLPHTVTSGPLIEDFVNPGTYKGTIPPLPRFTGPAQITTTIRCGGTVQRGSFSVYIDPSGFVVDRNGLPIHGASVTLARSDTHTGPFGPLPSGSAIMAPNNRANPTLTDAKGVYGWDVLSGFYILGASHRGCTSATSPVLTVPPPATGVRLTLNCPPTTLTRLKVKKLKKGKFSLGFRISAAGSINVTSTFVTLKSRGKKKHKVTRRVTVNFGRGLVVRRGAGGTVTVTVKPGSQAAAVLRKQHHLKVKVTIVYESTYGAVLTKTLTVTVR